MRGSTEKGKTMADQNLLVMNGNEFAFEAGETILDVAWDLKRKRALEKLVKKISPIVDFEALFVPDYVDKVVMIAPALDTRLRIDALEAGADDVVVEDDL